MEVVVGGVEELFLGEVDGVDGLGAVAGADDDNLVAHAVEGDVSASRDGFEDGQAVTFGVEELRLFDFADDGDVEVEEVDCYDGVGDIVCVAECLLELHAEFLACFACNVDVAQYGEGDVSLFGDVIAVNLGSGRTLGLVGFFVEGDGGGRVLAGDVDVELVVGVDDGGEVVDDVLFLVAWCVLDVDELAVAPACGEQEEAEEQEV